MFQDLARQSLERRFVLWPAVGVAAEAAVLTGIATAVTRGLDLDWPVWALGVGALGVSLGLEVGVQRGRTERMATLRPLFLGLIEAVGEAAAPRVTWSRGLPQLEMQGPVPWVVHLESAGSRLRIGITLAWAPAATGWLASRQPQDFPHRLERRLSARLPRLSIDDATLCALSREPAEAEAHFAEPSTLAAVRSALEADAPFAASLELGPDSVRWDVALHPGISPARLIELAAALPGLVGRRADAPSEDAAADPIAADEASVASADAPT